VDRLDDRESTRFLPIVVYDGDTTVDAMALTARKMNAKCTETSDGGLSVSWRSAERTHARARVKS
jgi:hypothetical protein